MRTSAFRRRAYFVSPGHVCYPLTCGRAALRLEGAEWPHTPMPLVESEAIILRSTAFAEADKLVSFFCRSHGRMRGVAPAGRKSRRRFGPALEPLTHVRMWFFDRENRDLTRLDQCEMIESFWDASPEYERSVALSHIAELCELLLPEREPHERNFRLTLMTLRWLGKGNSIDTGLAYFQVWSARLAGWLPDLGRCARCGTALAKEASAYASPSTGQIFCGGCRQGGTRRLSAGSRSIAQRVLSEPLTRLADTVWERKEVLELQRFVLDLVEHHAERKLATREFLHAAQT